MSTVTFYETTSPRGNWQINEEAKMVPLRRDRGEQFVVGPPRETPVFTRQQLESKSIVGLYDKEPTQ